MVAQFDAPSVVVFLVAVAVLSTFSLLDLRERRVSNRAISLGMLLGLVVVAASGQALMQLSLHILSLVIIAPLSYILWHLGAIGGADLKSLLLLSLLSPGLEFAAWDVLLEVALGDCFRVLAMLVLGLLYGRWKRSETDSRRDERTAPLVPLLLLVYVLSQFLAFV